MFGARAATLDFGARDSELLTPTLDFGAQDLGGESLSTLDFVSSTCRWDITVAAACNMS